MHALRIINKDGQAPTAEEITAANKVATTFKAATIGTFKVIDPIDDIEVEYHAHKALAFTQGGSSIYFGFDAAVDMRCKCRGVVLAETPAPNVVSVSRRINTGTSSNQSWDILVGDVVHSSHTGSVTNEPVGYNTWTNYLADLVGAWPGYIVNGISGSGETANLTFTTVTSYPAWIAAQAAADAINAANAATSNQRSAVFLTDGTELGSAAIVNPGPWISSQSGTTLNVIPYDKLWRGDGVAPLFDYTHNPADSVSHIYTRTTDLTFTVPDDACYQKVDAPSYPGSPPISINPLYDNIQKQWITDWNAAQSVALTREHARRKKCSDGQLAYLRNGFLPPEFEYFIKSQHPVSKLVRRDIPMEVTEYSNVTHSTIHQQPSLLGKYSTNVTTVSCRLTYVDTHGVEHTTAISGTLTAETWYGGFLPQDTSHVGIYPCFVYKYSNFPVFVGSGITGEGAHVSQLKGDEVMPAFVHDEINYWLFSILNGDRYSNGQWYPDDSINQNATYIPGLDPSTFPMSSFNVKASHPQFLYDYIAASKPIEKEIDIDGNKVPVTPSTNWLSSRLSHDEVVTVVPLSFVNAAGDDRGIYPYQQTSLNQEVIAQIKVVGFAKFKFNYFTSSFTFVSWTEFTTEGDIKHDGNATYDNETNPTSVTVGETTYTLEPKYFDYDPEFGLTNCVCIGNKAIWTDVKNDAKEQKKNISNNTPEGHELTAEEKLYKAVREAIA